MITHPALGIVVGADALGTVAGANLQLALGCHLLVRFPLLLLIDAAAQDLQRLFPVLELAALVLAFHYDAGGQVGHTDRRLGLVDMLSAGSAGTEHIHLQVAGINLHFHFLCLRQHCHCNSGGVDAALGFGFGHTLHPVHAAFELQAGIGALSGDGEAQGGVYGDQSECYH